MIRQLLSKFRQHKKEEPRKETCDYCKHIYYNSDGSVSCDSPFEKACLISGVRMYKEFT